MLDLRTVLRAGARAARASRLSTRLLLVVATAFTASLPAATHAQPPSFLSFESGPVRPLARSTDGTTLYVCNTPDGRLELVDLTGALPRVRASVAVGLEPVAVAVESPGRVWVVNHLSDSVSIVDVAADPPRVVRTLHVGDEPRDIVFAGPGRRRAFITTAHRGQNSPSPTGDFATPGIGRANVWVFDADDLGATSGTPLAIVRLFGDVPRALAVSPDGSRVYASVFLSGNRTTTVTEGAVCDGGPSVGPCTIRGVTYPGGLPPPITNEEGDRGPEVGLIIRQGDDGVWRDELARDWSAAVRFELPDLDVFELDANAATPSQVRSYAGVGTVLFDLAVNPVSGNVYVASTEAMNHVRFEGHGRHVAATGARPEGEPLTLRGHQHEARLSVLAGGEVTNHHLNPHIDYQATSYAPDVRRRTLATPVALAVSSDGATIYVAALGSSAIGVLDAAALEAGTVATTEDRVIPLRDPWPGGPVGLVLDEARDRLYVATRFDDAIVTVDLAARAVIGRLRLHSPEPEPVVVGRPVLYDAFASSSHGEASCGSCHVYGDLDGLAWDLGDPDEVTMPNPNPTGPLGSNQPFSPLKGPMTTQSFRGLEGHGPMHWRGDRTGGYDGGDAMDVIAAFEAFDAAFDGLLGRNEGLLSDAEMRRFARFATSIVYPPNPIRALDDSLRPDEARGRQIYFEREAVDTITTCNGCHVLDRARGFFGSDGRTTFENEPQEFKVAHLRNMYAKVGMFGMPSVPFIHDIGNAPRGPQVRGFGYLHDGSFDTLLNFFHATVFNLNDQDRRDLEAFMMAFDTNLAPIVGQQVTLDAEADGAALARAMLLLQRAATPFVWAGGAITTECDLVVRGVLDGEDRGWLFQGGSFRSDRASEPALAPATLLALATSGAATLTATCAPPGSGVRMALDRDEDGTFDRDELDAGGDPADRPLFDVPPIEPEGTPRPDGGMPGRDGGGEDPDAGARRDGGSDAGSEGEGEAGGCGCHSSAPSGVAWLAFATLFLLRRRR